jgi:hypothetical protein
MFGPAGLKMILPNEGFCVDDESCPLLLGNGFGPPVYRELYEIWNDVSKRDMQWFNQNCSAAVPIVHSLVKRLHPLKAQEMHEGALSSIISNTLQKLTPFLNPPSSLSLAAVHQVYVPDKTGVRADIAILDTEHDGISVHSLLEIKWVKEDAKFPEIEAASCSSRFFSAGASKLTWMPIFVISRTHFQIGVAFDGIQDRWAYSEIFEYKKDLSFDENDVLHLLRFLQYLLISAEHHRSYKLVVSEQCLADKAGNIIIRRPRVIGDRVLRGLDGSDGKSHKVFKFYANRTDAEDALRRQKDVFASLDLTCVAELKEGCSIDGVHAVVDDFHSSLASITNGHLKNLACIIHKLSEKGMVHGDLRLPNIRFGERDKVSLIDYEWAGPKGKTSFPMNVCKKSFGSQAARQIRNGMPIPDDFDWHCLFDILWDMRCKSAAARALTYDLEGVLNQLDVETKSSGHEVRNIQPDVDSDLNLRRLGFLFYTKCSFSSKRKRESSKNSSQLE